jgi:anti-sigma-K factor RskA
LEIKEYIESGILELYVISSLSSTERNKVERMVAQYPEIQTELESIEKALQAYAIAHAREPRKEVMQNILNEIENDFKKGTKTGKTISLHGEQHEGTGYKWLRSLAYAATILLFISIALNVYYYSNYKRVQGELADFTDQNTFLADQYDVLRANNEQLAKQMNELQLTDEQAAKELDILHNPEYVAIVLKSKILKPDATAIVYWNKGTGELYINANKLETPDSDKQYQLWALKGGRPIDAGIFDANTQLQQMKNIADADAFAITLEPLGGSEKPTLTRLQVLGDV